MCIDDNAMGAGGCGGMRFYLFWVNHDVRVWVEFREKGGRRWGEEVMAAVIHLLAVTVFFLCV